MFFPGGLILIGLFWCWLKSAFLVVLLTLVSGRPARKLSVDIVTLGYIYPNAGASLAYQGPALDMAAEEINRTYETTMIVQHTLLVDRKILNCEMLGDNSDFMLAKWYYGRKKKANVTAFISTSKCHMRGRQADS